MKRHFWLLFLFIILWLFASSGSAHDFVKLYNGVSPARRSLLSDASKGPDTALVAALDGTIYLLEVGSMKPLWSFSSGSQIYSSYQAPVNDKENSSGIESSYFIDCGDDWELYAHNSLGKLITLIVFAIIYSYIKHYKDKKLEEREHDEDTGKDYTLKLNSGTIIG